MSVFVSINILFFLQVTIKRKADVNMGTPKLVKKIRLEEKQGILKNSLLDHLNT